MNQSPLKIGIILGTTREGRVSRQVGEWVLTKASTRNDATFELLDLRDYPLPFYGLDGTNPAIEKWNRKLSELDGFIFVTAEYNHSIPAVLKNALDWAKDAWNNKAAGIVSYGSAYGARAAEHLRGILNELQIADVRTQVLLSLFTDFENYQSFKPQALHQTNLDSMLNQLTTWAKALKTIR
jgi:NAD(P)H-dependent FMN reductase